MIKLELIRIGPNIGRILGHKNRNVTNQANASLVAIGFEGKPLSEEKKLKELMGFNLIVERMARPSELVGFAPDQRAFPFVPRCTTVGALECAKECVIIKPGRVLFSEYMLPFEIASLLLLVAMIGAVVMAKKKI